MVSARMVCRVADEDVKSLSLIEEFCNDRESPNVGLTPTALWRTPLGPPIASGFPSCRPPPSPCLLFCAMFREGGRPGLGWGGGS